MCTEEIMQSIKARKNRKCQSREIMMVKCTVVDEAETRPLIWFERVKRTEGENLPKTTME